MLRIDNIKKLDQELELESEGTTVNYREDRKVVDESLPYFMESHRLF